MSFIRKIAKEKLMAEKRAQTAAPESIVPKPSNSNETGKKN